MRVSGAPLIGEIGRLLKVATKGVDLLVKPSLNLHTFFGRASQIGGPLVNPAKGLIALVSETLYRLFKPELGATPLVRQARELSSLYIELSESLLTLVANLVALFLKGLDLISQSGFDTLAFLGPA